MRSRQYNFPGCFFAFEGADGVGKSTIAKCVTEELSKKGNDTLFLSFPGHEPNSLGKIIYDLHHNSQYFGVERISPTSLQMLHIAAYQQR